MVLPHYTLPSKLILPELQVPNEVKWRKLMKKNLRVILASVLLCLMFSVSTLAGDTPISNVTDGDTPISNVSVPKQSGSDDESAFEFTKRLAEDLVSFFLYFE